jgi:nickel-dependent lactate racemase
MKEISASFRTIDQPEKNMKSVELDLGRERIEIPVPRDADVLAMGRIEPLPSPARALRSSLNNPIQSHPLTEIVRNRLSSHPEARAVLVISDNTRPVPYSGPSGILLPVIERLIQAGLAKERILILVATGSHHPLGEQELKTLLDPRIFSMGIPVLSHDGRENKDLVRIGRRKMFGDIRIHRAYIRSEIKILTGLVESHFMAGASGGRKSICPGLMGERSIEIIHGGRLLAHPSARDLVLEGNPVHEEALQVARMAGCDMIINVVLDAGYNPAGYFSGNLEEAHRAAVDKLKSFVSIPVQKKYDLVIGHAGYVGINHYQAAKAGTVCASVLKRNGICVLAARHTDVDPVGSMNYRKMLQLLNEAGARAYEDRITSPEWTFVPEQWEPQMWARLFKVIPPENLIYATLDIPPRDFETIPGTDARRLAPDAGCLEELTAKAVEWALKRLGEELGRPPETAVLKDGPYGIPVYK